MCFFCKNCFINFNMSNSLVTTSANSSVLNVTYSVSSGGDNVPYLTCFTFV